MAEEKIIVEEKETIFENAKKAVKKVTSSTPFKFLAGVVTGVAGTFAGKAALDWLQEAFGETAEDSADGSDSEEMPF